jgi:hypothetical protein
MSLQPSSFSEPVRGILAGLTERPFALIHTTVEAEDTARGLDVNSAAYLFPDARYPQEALSGLLLRLNRWEASHELSQDLNTAEGSYWHGIAHRLEPDYGNASYWFRRVGRHAIFPRLQAAAAQILVEQSTPWKLKEHWDPFLFVAWCEEVNRTADPSKLKAAIAIQKAEWELLFEWCAAPI